MRSCDSAEEFLRVEVLDKASNTSDRDRQILETVVIGEYITHGQAITCLDMIVPLCRKYSFLFALSRGNRYINP